MKISKNMFFDDDYPKKKIGNGNPYHCCTSCGYSDPHINGCLENHASYCVYRQSKVKELIYAGKYVGKSVVDTVALNVVLEVLRERGLHDECDLLEETIFNLN